MNCATYVTASTLFEAARKVGILPHDHRSRRLHGHSFIARIRTRLGTETWADFPGDEPRFLESRLKDCVRDLDYRYLNDIISVPTDENISRYISSRMAGVPGVEMVGVQSTDDAGVNLDEHNQAHVWRKFRFEAAHQLPNVPAGHQCGRMHGHSFEVIIHAGHALGRSDLAVDFDSLIDCWQRIHEQLDHACLNDVAGLENPTSEVIAAWIWRRLKPDLPELAWVSVYETATAGCHFDGESYRIWKEFRFESALRLARAPTSDRRSCIHGHSYLARLHLGGPLDDVLGWTVDYGDVKERFKPLHAALDHHQLNGLAGLEDADTISLLGWMRSALSEVLPELERIDLFETQGAGAFLLWGDNGPALPAQHR